MKEYGASFFEFIPPISLPRSDSSDSVRKSSAQDKEPALILDETSVLLAASNPIEEVTSDIQEVPRKEGSDLIPRELQALIKESCQVWAEHFARVCAYTIHIGVVYDVLIFLEQGPEMAPSSPGRWRGRCSRTGSGGLVGR